MANKHGNLSISSENIFPIIKKWMYSDQDIFIRELISNGCDAITKLKKLEMMGEYQAPKEETDGSEGAGLKGRIDVLCDDKNKTLKFIDNGIGMDAEEVDKFINQIAFSGATDFLEKYKDKSDTDQIIGHFGLGFYSSFMVADKVTIDSLSYKEGAQAVHWECDGEATEFDITDGDRSRVGTEITLYLNDDCLKYSNEYAVREVLEKYCSFMPTEIYLKNVNAEPPKPTKDKDGNEVPPEAPKPINDTAPLWTKAPKDCTDEEYKEFYRKVFRDYKEPLFWIHLNMDYPFNLKGILYFPKINIEYESIEGVIKLYNNQVFIADNIKEVIPEFLMLLKGVIDCPDLPLNVSRSALQNDGFVTKISDYITKKVAEKLSGMCKTDKENYEKYWEDISPFIKYGYLRNDKFSEKINDYILFKDINGEYLTLPECLKINPTDTGDEEEGDTEKAEGTENNGEAASEEKTEEVEKASGDVVDENGETVETVEDMLGEDAPEEKTEEAEKTSGDVVDEKGGEVEKKETVIYYVTDEKQQGQYIAMFKKAKMNAVILKHNIDTPFMQQLEMKNEGIKFKRIDADVTDAMKAKESKKDTEKFESAAKDIAKLLKKALKREKLEVKVQRLKNKKIASMLTMSEESRRMQDMMKMYSMGGDTADMFKDDEGETLILNAGHPLVERIMDQPDSENAKLITEQLYYLAVLQNKQLSPEAMAKFIEHSNECLLKI
ncbi:MAG: molecular chaperone HtpG [Lachnospiraceae bacterium]|nr:molecular chaperone HtpG [Lachnospiraceae bacterium]